jgi:hypothetical protein
MNILNWFKRKYFSWKREKEYQKKLKELKKRDPFNYKNF